jgi:peptide/nickel transport system ATP-binding protein
VRGEIPSAIEPPAGCHFHPRCPYAMPRCREGRPPLKEVAPEHFSACLLD